MELDGWRCAYCRSPMIVVIPMVVEHIVPIISAGPSVVDNLFLSCYRSNEFKWARQTAPDPSDGHIAALFHPRQQPWQEYFAWADEATAILGLTASGRATVELLRLNNDWIVQARRLWARIGLQPPLDIEENK